MKRLIVIGGATATGKTALAIELARRLDTVVLSADSRQFFREMSIGTAKPSEAELATVPHLFINHLSIETDYSVGDFEKEALQALELIFREKDTAILTGGSGLYLRAVCEGLDVFPEISRQTRETVDAGFEQYGIEWLQEKLATLDPDYFEQVDRQNPARLRRAVEVCLQTNQPFSSFRKQHRKKRPFEPVYLLLELPREELYARIDARVDDMVLRGLETEARNLLPYRHKPALKTVGYEEFFDYFDGKIDYPSAVEKIKQHSRNYAKRQMTWFRKYGNWHIIHPDDLASIIRYLKSKGIDII